MGPPKRPRRRSRRPRASPMKPAPASRLTLSDSFCVGRFRAEFLDLMRKGLIDTIFSNTDEVLSLYETEDFGAALSALRAEGVLGVVTRSEKGSIVLNGEETHEVPAFHIDRRCRHDGRGRLVRLGLSRRHGARRSPCRLRATRRAGGGGNHPASRRATAGRISPRLRRSMGSRCSDWRYWRLTNGAPDPCENNPLRHRERSEAIQRS